MEDLLELFPRWMVAAVLGPFLLGVVVLALLVEPTSSGMAFVYLLFVGGVFVLVLLALGLTLTIRQSKGLQQQPGSDRD